MGIFGLDRRYRRSRSVSEGRFDRRYRRSPITIGFREPFRSAISPITIGFVRTLNLLYRSLCSTWACDPRSPIADRSQSTFGQNLRSRISHDPQEVTTSGSRSTSGRSTIGHDPRSRSARSSSTTTIHDHDRIQTKTRSRSTTTIATNTRPRSQ